jgi:WD40 repeat protein
MPDDRSVFFRSGNRLGVWRFEAGDHFHRLPLWNGNESGVSPDGRWYAYSSPSGLQVYDINARKRAALWLGPGWRGVHFAPDGKSIVASEIPIRVFHWPLRFEGPTGLTLDPPATLLQRYTSHEGGLLAADGTHLAHINVAVVSWHNLQQQRDVYSWADHPNVAGMDVSPDGNWLATGTFHGHSVKVRDLRTGKLARDLRSLGTANVVFSPNSKWLVTCSSDDHCLWETGSWTRLHTFRRLSLGNFASSAVFSPDSKYLAIDPSPNTLQIVDPRTGHEFLTLEMPRYPANSMAKGMTANGDTLIGGVTGNVHGMWDIRGLRERLREMKLDWDDPL